MVHIGKPKTSERLQRMAVAYERAAWGYASELEHTMDEKRRDFLKGKLTDSRAAAKLHKERAQEFRDKGD